jgi:iron complex outermembrane receptor protein
VAQLNANKWAVSVRGFNALYANKLLVMVDGRSIYNHLFSGVFWDTVDIPLQDIDRIEVVRGPGGSVWGANAVNGVINIVTRPAGDTQGAAVRVSAGSFDGQQAGIRYGGMTHDGAYRVFAQWSRHEPSIADGQAADDPSRSASTGFRVDGSRPAGSYLLEGGLTDNQASSLWKLAVSPDPAVAIAGRVIPSHNVNANALARWTSVHRNGATWQVQSSVDLTRRTDSNVATGRNATDIDAHYHLSTGHHDLVAGAGYRATTEWATQKAWGFSLDPAHQTEHLVNMYAQDEVDLGSKARLTGGAKIEYSNEVGVGVQPTVRVLVMPTAKQRAWASLSRALRTPSLVERAGVLNFAPTSEGGMPFVIRKIGDPRFQPEVLVTPEAGYRFEASARLSVDVAVFFNRYQNLGSDEPSAPFVETEPGPARVVLPVQFGNLFGARTMGVEASARWRPVPAWSLDASYTHFHATPVGDSTSRDPGIAGWDGEAPAHQWQIRSTVTVSRTTEVSALLLHTGDVASTATPAFTRGDVRVAFTITPRVTLEVTGHNLFAPSHVEMFWSSIMDTTRIPRAGRARVTWRF